ncbi:MAG: hypothetical protein AAGK32_02700, partial [Actinomycetota bacterium]
NDNLEVKGGLLGDRLLTVEEIDQLAKVAPREELLAKLAGGLAAPLQKMAGFLQAVPRDFAYGLAALIEQGGGVDAAEEPEPEAAAEAATDDTDTEDAAGSDESTEDAEDPAPAEASDDAASDDAENEDPTTDSDSEEG